MGEWDVSKRTPATMVLEKAGKRFELLTYEYDPDAPSIGLQAAEALGLEPSVVFKTLMAEVEEKVKTVLGVNAPITGEDVDE